MNKIMSKINFKDKKVYIPLIIVSILLVILLLFGVSNLVSLLSNNKKYKEANGIDFIDKLGEDENRKSFSVNVNEVKIDSEDENSETIKEDCTSKNICISDVDVLCYEDRGVIEFTVVNKSSSDSNGGFLNLKIGGYTAVIWYDAVKAGASVKGFHSYDEYDFKSLIDEETKEFKEKYSVDDLGDDEKSSLTHFGYYDCGNGKPRSYYLLDYEGNRIYSANDDDVKYVNCRNIVNNPDTGKQEEESAWIYVRINPCEKIEEKQEENKDEENLPLCSEFKNDQINISIK